MTPENRAHHCQRHYAKDKVNPMLAQKKVLEDPDKG